MTKSLLQSFIPVFLPGNNRDWIKADGFMDIDDTGKMTVQLDDSERVKMFISMVEADPRILWQCAFDYRQNGEQLRFIHQQFRKLNDPVYLVVGNGSPYPEMIPTATEEDACELAAMYPDEIVFEAELLT